jgi:hypothetical protein
VHAGPSGAAVLHVAPSTLPGRGIHPSRGRQASSPVGRTPPPGVRRRLGARFDIGGRRLGITQHTARAPSRRVWPGRVAFASSPTSAATATTRFGRARHTSRFRSLRTVWGIIPRPSGVRDAPPSGGPSRTPAPAVLLDCLPRPLHGNAPARHPTRVRWQWPCERPLKGVRCKGTPKGRARTTDAKIGEERR